MARTKPPAPGAVAGTPCPYTSEYTDGICGEMADHYSRAARAYLCAEHYQTVTASGVSAAAICPNCGEDRSECVCRGVEV